ncbi:MAG TPA: oxygenase MpaB family protein [Candidatus Limnocylindria bacterium]
MPDPVLPEPSVARRLNRELFLLLGGTAALLMQVAHPLVAAGVEQHSDFRRDPIGRLRRTLNTTLAVVFAEPDEARAALRRIDRRHGPVRGAAADGRAYEARDPALLLWVQATLVLTSLRLYELIVGALPAADREAYWQETRPIAAALGIPLTAQPVTIADLERYERLMLATAARPDTTSVRVARDVLRPFRWIPDPVYWPTDAIAAALVPGPLRAPFGLRYRMTERLFFTVVIATVRVMRTVLPAPLTVVPQARRFETRRSLRRSG